MCIVDFVKILEVKQPANFSEVTSDPSEHLRQWGVIIVCQIQQLFSMQEMPLSKVEKLSWQVLLIKDFDKCLENDFAVGGKNASNVG